MRVINMGLYGLFGLLLAHLGFDIAHWQFWALLLLTCCIHLTGALSE